MSARNARVSLEAEKSDLITSLPSSAPGMASPPGTPSLQGSSQPQAASKSSAPDATPLKQPESGTSAQRPGGRLKADDYYETPPELFEELNREFSFTLDACATDENTKVPGRYFTEKDNALQMEWGNYSDSIFCNPPYSKEGQKDAFIRKAAEAAKSGATVVMVIPAKVNTRAFHRYIWDRKYHRARPCVEVRFLEGRPVFYLNGKRAPGAGRNEIMVIVFRPVGE